MENLDFGVFLGHLNTPKVQLPSAVSSAEGDLIGPGSASASPHAQHAIVRRLELSRFVTDTKEEEEEAAGATAMGSETFLEILLAILLPPLGVFLRYGIGVGFTPCVSLMQHGRC